MIARSEKINAAPADAYARLKVEVEQEKAVAGRAAWDDAKRTGVIDYMGVRAELSVSDAAQLDVVASVGFPASIKYSEEDLGGLIDKVIGKVKQAFV